MRLWKHLVEAGQTVLADSITRINECRLLIVVSALFDEVQVVYQLAVRISEVDERPDRGLHEVVRSMKPAPAQSA